MSGLVDFFRAFWAPVPADAKHPSDENKPPEEAYRQSLSSRASYESARSSLHSKLNVEKEKEKNRSNQHHEQDGGEEQEAHSPVDAGTTRTENGEMMEYKEWRINRNEALKLYMEHRILRIEKSAGDDMEEEEEHTAESEVPDNDGLELPWGSQLESQEPETQELAPLLESPLGATPITPTTSTSTKNKRMQKKITHIDDTANEIKSIDFIDLNTRLLHLGLLKVDKVWGCRRTRRAEWQDHSKMVTGVPLNTSEVVLLTLPFKFFEEDGPVSTLFRNVLSVEVTQLHDAQELEERNKTAAPFGGRSGPTRLRIFFYGQYARHVASFLDGTSEKSTRLLSLSNVPAMCVLPYQPSSWFDRENLAEYCLCIGDISRMKSPVDGGGATSMRFDSEDLKVVLASQQGKKRSNHGELAVREVELSQGIVEAEDVKPNPSSALFAAYEKVQKSQQTKTKDASASPFAGNGVPVQTQINLEEAKTAAAAPSNNAGATRRDAVNESERNGPSPKKSKTTVEYCKLDELRRRLDEFEAKTLNGEAKLEANFYGTILGFTCPCRTKRDWMISMTIVDETLRKPKEECPDTSACPCSITINVFAAKKGDLPEPRFAGDIIRCHRVAVQDWQGDIQLRGLRKSSYVVIRPKLNVGESATADDPDSWTIVPTAKQFYTFEQSDYRRAEQLWRWAQERILSFPTILKEEHCIKLKDLKLQGEEDETSYGDVIDRDLTVMVSSILPKEFVVGTPLGYLRVWDGTGASQSDPLPLATVQACQSIKTGDPPVEALVSIRDTVHALLGDDMTENDYNAAPSRFSIVSELEPPKKLCGRVMNVAIWESAHWELIQDTLCVGSFIRLRNIQEKKNSSGLRCIMVHSKTQLTPLPQRTYEVCDLLERHHERVIRKDPYNPQSGLLPLGNAGFGFGDQGENAAASGSANLSGANSVALGRQTLAQCIQGAPFQLFHVSFRIVRTTPDVDSSEIGLQSLCQRSKEGNSGQEMQYRFAVHLSDGTGEIDALVSNDLAGSLLGRTADDACKCSYRATEILHVVTNPETSWDGTIKSTIFEDAKYFILQSATIAKGDDLSSLPAHTW